MIIEYINIDKYKNLGGKIQNLLKIKDSFNIPKGFIITEKKDLYLVEIEKTYKKYLSTQFYICRSSMVGEDSCKLSYAGLFESIEGYIQNGWLKQDIIDVFDSINNDFLDEYEKNVIGEVQKERKMNVLVQELIIGEVSGIYFSKYKGDDKIIEYIKGCNQFLVDGTVKGNKIILDSKFKILEHIKNKQYKYIGESLEIFIYEKENNSLNNIYLEELLNILKNLETFFDFDIDVEWTIRDGNVYILQVRPITIKI